MAPGADHFPPFLLVLRLYPVPLDQLPFVNHPTISFSSKDAVEMPFRYLAMTAEERRGEEGEGKEGEPLMPRGMRDLLRRDLDRGWEFDNE